MNNVALSNARLLWLDLETTGLDENEHAILEIGMVVTDGHLNVLDSLTRVIQASDVELAKMSDYVRKMHIDSGLLDQAQLAPYLCMIEPDAVAFVKSYFDKPALLHGNTIHFDRRFIRRHMPDLEKHLAYRMVDVSSFKETLALYSPGLEPQKRQAHRALADIDESILEFRTYLTKLGLL